MTSDDQSPELNLHMLFLVLDNILPSKTLKSDHF